LNTLRRKTCGLPFSIAVVLVVVIAVVTTTVTTSSLAGIETSKHNMSITGTGTIKAVSEDRICIFCHITHGARPIAPLWNALDSNAAYILYDSSSFKASAQNRRPDGASLLCLSCHDGTIALGEVNAIGRPDQSNTIQLIGTSGVMPQGKSLIGTDLSDDHPISFEFNSALSAAHGELAEPSTLTGPVKLDALGKVQCTSCHDPHNDAFGKFLVMDNRGSSLCEACHKPRTWSTSPHNISAADWNLLGKDPWPNSDYTTVGDNGCSNCHTNHSAQHPERLLNELTEEDVCLGCHNGNVGPNVDNDFKKLSAHPIIDTVGVHDPGEPALVANRHVECVDCHTPHGAGVVAGTPGNRGFDIQGNLIDPVTNVYQLCFRCHGDSPGLLTPTTSRMIPTANMRAMFDPANPAFHPVAAVGKNPTMPSLLPPWTPTSQMGCDGCHGSDTGISAPHGSNNPSILRLRYEKADRTPESPAVYALCYSCHNRNSILNNDSFPEHQIHIVGQSTPCNVCHDPHGLSLGAGANTNNKRLVNFDTSIVAPSQNNGTLSYSSNGNGTGTCSLLCHQNDHDNRTY